MCDKRRRRLRWAGVGLGAIAVIIVAMGTRQAWWPGGRIILSWLGTWWWTLAAVVALAGGGVLFWASARQPASRPAGSSSVVWEQAPGQRGLLARTVAPVAPTPEPAAGGEQRRRWNWSALASAVTALAALGALVFTAQSLSTTEQGQITDRYTKAIDQIGTQGADHLETRLGGIYALERLTKDSPRDQPTIVQVLSAFVRANLPQTTDAEGCPTPAKPGPNGIQRRLRLDLQAALAVLGRRDHANDNGVVVDLTYTCLNGMQLLDVNLEGANLNGANLSDADLLGADLSGAVLRNANLRNAQLGGADLGGAELRNANLRAADLPNAYLRNADLSGADLRNANLGDTHLEGANLGANLAGANLRNARLHGADLRSADLRSADLGGADLCGARLDGARHDNDTVTEGAVTAGATGTWW